MYELSFSLFVYSLAALGVLAPLLLVFFIWDRSRLLRRIGEIEEQVGVVVPFWSGVEHRLVRHLLHRLGPERKQLRTLLHDLEHSTLDKSGKEVLIELVNRCVTDSTIDGEQRRRLALLPLVMAEAEKERLNDQPPSKVQLLGIKEE